LVLGLVPWTPSSDPNTPVFSYSYSMKQEHWKVKETWQLPIGYTTK
jgi:hypothetical protein